MINRTLKQVEQMINGTGLAEQYEGITIQGVSIDTRKIEKETYMFRFKVNVSMDMLCR